MNHLLSIEDLDRAAIERICDRAAAFEQVGERDIKKVPALRGKTVVSVFFEDSTRTRLSFETAAKRLSADTMSFSVGTSSGSLMKRTTCEGVAPSTVAASYSSGGLDFRLEARMIVL